MTTTAEMNALELGDGQHWTTKIGICPLTNLEWARRVQGAHVTYRDGVGTDTYRLTYPDGSAIVVAGSAWDLAVPGSDADDYCGASVGHASGYGCCSDNTASDEE